jgi:hypothetical protein
MLKRLVVALVLTVCAIAATTQAMEIGTNFWDNRWVDSNQVFINKRNVTGDNPWNPVFLQEIDFYTMLRFMDWNGTNKSARSEWSQRRQKSNKVQETTVAYEWMIDLCNKVNADMWTCIPHKTVGVNNDTKPCDYALRLAILVKTGVDMKTVNLTGMYDNLSSMSAQQFIQAGGVKTCEPLKSTQKLYVEYSNEIWNSSFKINKDSVAAGVDPMNGQYVYCAAKGYEKNLTLPPGIPRDSVTMGQAWTAWASIRIFRSMELVFGANSPRIVKVLPAYGENAPSTVKVQWDIVYTNASLNVWNIKPNVVAIAPYFGRSANGNQDSVIAWDSLLNSKNSGMYAILKQIPNYYNYANNRGMKLVGYEGGQHMLEEPSKINYSPRMYTVYTEYLDSLDKYLTVFSHYVHQGNCGKTCYGAQKKTGDPLTINAAPKLKALYDWAQKHPVSNTIRPSATPLHRAAPSSFTNAQAFDLHGRRIDAARVGASRVMLLRDEFGQVVPRLGGTLTRTR